MRSELDLTSLLKTPPRSRRCRPSPRGGKFGEIGDARLTVTAALTVCDELDASARVRTLEEELTALRDVRVAAADRARTTQTAVAAALNSAADRIEKTTQVLNRTIGGGVAIG